MLYPVETPDFGQCMFFEGGFSGFQGTKYDGSGVVKRKSCDSGQFSLYGTTNCLDCPKGHYCPDNNKMFMPKTCRPGTYASAKKKTACDPCGAGKYSLFGATTCNECPAGYECPAANQVPKICKVGYYSAAGDTTCKECDEGFACHSGATRKDPPNQLCPIGVKCTKNSGLKETVCAAGKYLDTRGGKSGSCKTCTAGHYCPKGSKE